MHRFSIEKDRFVIDGRPTQIVSGAMHYFRIVPEYWEDRLRKLRACGCNAVETYVPWNLHEPEPGRFDFEGIVDIERYIALAGRIGLLVMVRPGPYICSEWEFGGLPAWLLADPGMRLRCAHPPYLEAVGNYFDALIPRLAKLQVGCGGPVVAVQIENEYGSYGNDSVYLARIEKMLRDRGIECLLFTSDGPTDQMLQGGTLPHIFKTANFGSGAKDSFDKLREYQPDGPLMCMEYWNGWFDHWGEQHHRRDPEDAARVLDDMLALGGSANLYMFHGGTNFGFMNGANCHGEYQPTITSYDYDAPLSESGDPTPKFHAFREVIGRYLPLPDEPVPPPLPRRAYGAVAMTQSIRLFDALGSLSKPVQRPTPESMEMLGQSYGFILYRTRVSGPRGESNLELQDLHDRAQVFLDGRATGVLERWDPEKKVAFTAPPEGLALDILVENMGRTNYGPWLCDRKGITEGARLGFQFLYGWTIHPLPLDDLSGLEFGGVAAPETEEPVFYRASFEIGEPADTFLALPGWAKGVVWVNGFNLGRYWETRGPQKTLYVPAPRLRKGRNEIIVLELHGCETPRVEFRDEPDLG